MWLFGQKKKKGSQRKSNDIFDNNDSEQISEADETKRPSDPKEDLFEPVDDRKSVKSVKDLLESEEEIIPEKEKPRNSKDGSKKKKKAFWLWKSESVDSDGSEQLFAQPKPPSERNAPDGDAPSEPNPPSDTHALADPDALVEHDAVAERNTPHDTNTVIESEIEVRSVQESISAKGEGAPKVGKSFFYSGRSGFVEEKGGETPAESNFSGDSGWVPGKVRVVAGGGVVEDGWIKGGIRNLDIQPSRYGGASYYSGRSGMRSALSGNSSFTGASGEWVNEALKQIQAEEPPENDLLLPANYVNTPPAPVLTPQSPEPVTPILSAELKEALNAVSEYREAITDCFLNISNFQEIITNHARGKRWTENPGIFCFLLLARIWDVFGSSDWRLAPIQISEFIKIISKISDNEKKCLLISKTASEESVFNPQHFLSSLNTLDDVMGLVSRIAVSLDSLISEKFIVSDSSLGGSSFVREYCSFLENNLEISRKYLLAALPLLPVPLAEAVRTVAEKKHAGTLRAPEILKWVKHQTSPAVPALIAMCKPSEPEIRLTSIPEKDKESESIENPTKRETPKKKGKRFMNFPRRKSVN